MNELSGMSAEDPAAAVFPRPRTYSGREGVFRLDGSCRIRGMPDTPPDDRLAAHWFSDILVDEYQLALLVDFSGRAPQPGTAEHGWVVMGLDGDPRLSGVRRVLGAQDPAASLPPEGYALEVRPGGILLAGADRRGLLFGLQTLRQLVRRDGEGLIVPCCTVRDAPHKPFRGLRMFLPGADSMPFFKRFVRDLAVYFKYNTLILEVNAAMRLRRHPELNAGWLEFGRSLNHTRRDRPRGPHGEYQDSAHHDTGDFGLVDPEEVAELVQCARRYGLEVIPEVPSLTHAYYLLTRHRELAEITDAEWPDTYCPQAPGVYELYFEVLDEYIQVMRPRTVHIGHDEWRMPMDQCPRCRGRDYRELFAADVARIHDHLARRDIRAAMWGDHLLESIRGVGERPQTSRTGWRYRMPAGLTAEQVADKVPRDILVLNWFWNRDKQPQAREAEKQLSAWGFEQVYGNLTPRIAGQDYARRSGLPGLLGGAPSLWTASRELDVGKDVLLDFMGCSQVLWSGPEAGTVDPVRALQPRVPAVRRRMRGAFTAGERVRSPGSAGEGHTAGGEALRTEPLSLGDAAGALTLGHAAGALKMPAGPHDPEAAAGAAKRLDGRNADPAERVSRLRLAGGDVEVQRWHFRVEAGRGVVVRVGGAHQQASAPQVDANGEIGASDAAGEQAGEPMRERDPAPAHAQGDSNGGMGPSASHAAPAHAQGSRSAPVTVDADPESLLFLHACALPAQNLKSHFTVYNPADSADLLGWYEVTYGDGFVLTVPLRYGVDLCEWTWGRNPEPETLCWGAAAVECSVTGGEPATFFAMEWVNPRPGKRVRHVRLCGTQGFVDAHGRPIAENRLLWAALSLVPAGDPPAARDAGR